MALANGGAIEFLKAANQRSDAPAAQKAQRGT
jgi:hypothetical protein